MSGTTRITCGDFGGRTRNGERCRRATFDGPCYRHQDAVATQEDEGLATANDVLDPSTLFKVPPFKRYRDKVAILGFTSHRIDALELDDSWEIWGLNELYRYMPADRFHRWFEIHGREYLAVDDDGKKHMEDLKSVLAGAPIYMQKHHADIPCSVKFPIDEMSEQLGSEYFTNCPAMMVAFATWMGYKSISVYGVDMAQDSEYGTQRPCCEYWLGRAIGAGIKVFVPDMSDLLKCVGIYAYEGQGSVLTRKMNERLKWLHAQDNDRLAALRGLEAEYKRQHNEISSRIQRRNGALRELKGMQETEELGNRVVVLEAEVASMNDDLGKLNTEYNGKHAAVLADRNQMVGGIKDVEYWLRSWLPKVEPTGGGASPTQETRAQDPALGIQAPSGDSVPGSKPVAVPAV